MSEEMSLEEANAEAVRRIHAAKACGQWWLDLGDLPITRVPDEIAQLKDTLRVLALGKQKLIVDGQLVKWDPDIERPGSISDLTPLTGLPALATLRVSSTEVSDLRPLIGMSALRELVAHGCEQLKFLELRGNRHLSKLGLPLPTLKSVTLEGSSALEELVLTGCKVLESVELRDLSRLKTFYVHGFGRFVSVQLDGMPALRDLTIGRCQAPSFAQVRQLLGQLSRLAVYSSHFPDLHPSVCGRNYTNNVLDSVRAYYAALGPDAKPDAEVRVFVLGNGRCGKSYLIQRLTGKSWEQIEAEKIVTTHGVQLGRFEVPKDWGFDHPITLCFWDFGGQDIYHGTHALFLKEPAIYLLLHADATENTDEFNEGGFDMQNRPLGYWFDYLRQEAGRSGVVNSPVLLVKSRSDEKRPAVAVPSPDAKAFPNISPVIPVSAKDPRGLKHLMPALEDAIRKLLDDHPQPPLPVSWAKVRDRIREMQPGAPTSPRRGEVGQHVRTMSLAGLKTLCDECGCNPGDEVFLRDALALMGVVYYRQGVFGDRIIVDQGWALDAIYTVFKRDKKEFQDEIDDKHGKFNRKQLERYFWKEQRHTEDDQRTFLSFMEQCGICFRTSDRHATQYDGFYILPDKLDRWGQEQEKEFQWNERNAAHSAEVTATFTLLHDGIARGFLSKIGSVAGDGATYWRYGCHFHDNATDCKVMTRTDGNTIRMHAWGEKSTDVLRTLLKVLERVPCGNPPEISWSEPPAEPIRIGRTDPDEQPEERLKPSKYGPKSVFFSYRHPHEDHPGSDRGRVLLRELRDLLATDGWTVLLDENELHGGDSISAFIAEVRQCGFFVPVFCERYLDSRYTLSELFTFREKFAHDELAFADRTAAVVFPESKVKDDHQQGEYAERCVQRFAEYGQSAGTFRLAPRVYQEVYHLRSWSERLSEVLASLSDRLNCRTAATVADRLNRQYARLNPSRRA